MHQIFLFLFYQHVIHKPTTLCNTLQLLKKLRNQYKCTTSKTVPKLQHKHIQVCYVLLRITSFIKFSNKFHSNFAVPFIEVLLKKFENVFEASDLPVLDSSNTQITNITLEVSLNHGLENLKILYSWYCIKKSDVFNEKRTEGFPLIYSREENFVSECFLFAKLTAKNKQRKNEYKWVKTFKNGPSKICRRESLKSLKWYGLSK